MHDLCRESATERDQDFVNDSTPKTGDPEWRMTGRDGSRVDDRAGQTDSGRLLGTVSIARAAIDIDRRSIYLAEMSRRWVRNRFRIRLHLALVLVSVQSSSASADPADDANAQAVYRQGKQMLDQGKAQAALDLFQTAERLSPQPVIILAIADCFRLLDKPAAALRAYRRYQKEWVKREANKPMPREKEVAQAIQELGRRVPPSTSSASGLQRSMEDPTKPPDVVTTVTIHRTWWFWTIIAVAVAGITSGVATGATPIRSGVPEGTIRRNPIVLP
jgi:hypothetical protein